MFYGVNCCDIVFDTIIQILTTYLYRKIKLMKVHIALKYQLVLKLKSEMYSSCT
jgi:hypothetical protein